MQNRCRLAFVVPLLWLLTPSDSFAQLRIEPEKKYAAAVQSLEAFIQHEMAAKELPALSIALVDDHKVVWSAGFGFANPSAKTPATAETVYRVGSVSKLFTDIAVMQLVEQGKIDLDAAVTNYLPEFKPKNPFSKAITMRQLMAHRSGLVREPPTGNYFDPTHPTLAETVASLNQTELVYAPETRIKYSNAAVATVGYALEKTQNEPFAAYVQRRVMEPLGMKRSGFLPTPELCKDLAVATMWTYHGRNFTAPTFELGMAPAGSMYSTVNDLARFVSVLLADGKGILQPATLHQMFTPQFAKPEQRQGFGIGFQLGELQGRKRIGHGGAIYGFATELAFLPEDKLGVVVIASKDGANGLTTRIADAALSSLHAIRQNQPLPKFEITKPLDPELPRKLPGRYRSGGKHIDLIERAGKLWLMPGRGGFRSELRALGDALVVDDNLDYGMKLIVEGDKLRLGSDIFEKVVMNAPASPPAHWLPLIGEYGWDHNTLVILEKDGKLHALIEWFFLDPLEEVSESVFKFPDSGLYQGEQLVFRRDPKTGRATQVEAANVVFKRRAIDGEDGATFRIRPERPVQELRKEALAAKPPPEKGEFGKPDLVDLTSLDDTIKLDIRYASDNNFLGTPLYTTPKAYMQRPAAEALVKVHRRLAERGFGLLIHDAYRPWYVTKIFWEATPVKQHMFVADPALGSRHNRGCAVDLTLFDRKTGKVIDMVGGYDEFSDRSYPDYWGGTSLQRWHRDLLRRAMEVEFSVYEAEWWHFDYKDWRKYPIGNETFERLMEKARK